MSTKGRSRRLVTTRAELTLAQDDAYPLRRVPLKPDPLQALADVFALVERSQGDDIEIVLDLLAMTPAASRHWRQSHVRDITEADSFTAPSWRSDLRGVLYGTGGASSSGGRGRTGGASGVGVPVRTYGLERADKMRTQRVLSESLANPEPHFEFQLLIRCRSQTRGRAVALLQATLAAFHQFDGENSLRAVGRRRAGGFRFAGADSAFRRRGFDRRIDTWRFMSRDNNVVGVSEIAGLLKPVTKHCVSDHVYRGQGTLGRIPQDLVTYDFNDPAEGLYFVGAVETAGVERLVGARAQDTLFTYNPGRSGWGKSEANLVRFVEMARTDTAATLFLDPHADALEKAKPYLAALGLAGRIVELSTVSGSSHQVGWNPFARSNLWGDDAIGRQTQIIVDSFAATMGWGNNRAPRALAILQASVQALLELSLRLPAGLSPTVFQISTLLLSESWRDQIVEHLSPKRQRFWIESFPKMPDEANTPITNFIERLAGVEAVASLFGSPVSTWDLRSAIDSKKIILVRLRGTGEMDRLVASLVVNDLMKAILGRADIAPEDRVPTHCWFDEVQEYDAAVKAQIAALLEQTRKYGMRLHLLNQDPAALQQRTFEALMNNRSHLFAAAVSNEPSAVKLAKGFRHELVTSDVVANVEKYHAIAQTTGSGVQSDPYRIRSIGLEEAYGRSPDIDHDRLQARIDHNSGRRPIGEILAEQDELEARIIDHLHTSRPAPDRSRLPAASDTLVSSAALRIVHSAPDSIR